LRNETFIICDDIRFEMGNKKSLIGIYDDRIFFNVERATRGIWPKSLKLGIYSRFIYDDANISPSSFEIIVKQSSSDRSILKGNLKYNEDKKKNRVITIAAIVNNFIFDSVGQVNFDFLFYDASGELIDTVTITNKLLCDEIVVGEQK